MREQTVMARESGPPSLFATSATSFSPQSWREHEPARVGKTGPLTLPSPPLGERGRAKRAGEGDLEISQLLLRAPRSQSRKKQRDSASCFILVFFVIVVVKAICRLENLGGPPSRAMTIFVGN
jgi:hypothetical protein